MKGRKLLDALTVLALVFALLIFYLVMKITEFRGNGGNDENKNLRGFSFTPIPPDEMSPPNEPPIFISMSGACCPVQHLVEKREGGNAIEN